MSLTSSTGPKIITIIGSLNMDLVTTTDRMPAGGETMHAISFYTGPGGKGGNRKSCRPVLFVCKSRTKASATLARVTLSYNTHLQFWLKHPIDYLVELYSLYFLTPRIQLLDLSFKAGYTHHTFHQIVLQSKLCSLSLRSSSHCPTLPPKQYFTI